MRSVAQINLVVRDMPASIAFYRRLGLDVKAVPLPEWAPHHASVELPGGVQLDLDSVAFAKRWNPGWRESRGSGCVIFFSCATRDEVDRIHGEMTRAGYASQKDPEDAFWGARYAIVEDPDGNAIGLMSSIEDSMKKAPPPPPATVP